MKLGALVGGLAILIIGLVLQVHYGPIDQACRTVGGHLAQAVDAGRYRSCDVAATAAPGSWWLIVCGALMSVGAGLSFIKRRPRVSAAHPRTGGQPGPSTMTNALPSQQPKATRRPGELKPRKRVPAAGWQTSLPPRPMPEDERSDEAP